MIVFLYCVLYADKLSKLVGPVLLVAPALLRKHRVVFSGGTTTTDGGVATIAPKDDGIVLGLMYDMECEQVTLLDAIQGVHHGKAKRIKMEVEDPCRKTRLAYVYYRSEKIVQAPSDDYREAHNDLLFQAFMMFREARGESDSDEYEKQFLFGPRCHHAKKKRCDCEE